MKNHIYLSKAIVSVATLLLSSSFLSAWTVSVLDPASKDADTHIPERLSFSTFSTYITDTGSNLIFNGSLENYTPNSSDAVIVNLSSYAGYTTQEILVLEGLLKSNTRVLIFGELTDWKIGNGQIANIVSGTYNSLTNGSSNQTVNPDAFPVITDGVTDIQFGTPGILLPSGNNGLLLSSGGGISLWGENDNFLVFMDVDLLSEGILNPDTDNDRLAQNIAWWLSGANSPVPEPSSYVLIAGMATLGFVAIRRRKCK